MNNISLERLEQIELERAATAADPKFQEWRRELNVSRSYSDPSARLNGAELTNQYDYSKYKIKSW
jgi:hypothetical protein